MRSRLPVTHLRPEAATPAGSSDAGTRHPSPPGGAAPSGTLPLPRFVLAVLFVLFALSMAGCDEESPPRAGTESVDSVVEEAEPVGPPRAFERVLAFTTPEGGFPATPEPPAEADEAEGAPPEGTDPVGASGASAGASQDGPAPSDTLLAVPLFFTARTTEEGVRREIRGWVARGESWEPFADESWVTSPSRSAWRIIPRGAVRLVVGRAGALETVVFRDPPRVLELDLGEELVEWTGADGSTFRLDSAAAVFGSRTFQGLVLDMTRGRALSNPPSGDWAFLVSGDSLQIVLESPAEAPPGTEGAFRAFGRIDFRQLQWRNVTLDWSESRAYEPARRDVPGAWTFSSTEDIGPGPPLAGSLVSRSARLSPGTGEGPVLPVDALFIVSGTVALGDSAYPVHGLYRHRRE